MIFFHWCFSGYVRIIRSHQQNSKYVCARLKDQSDNPISQEQVEFNDALGIGHMTVPIKHILPWNKGGSPPRYVFII